MKSKSLLALALICGISGLLSSGCTAQQRRPPIAADLARASDTRVVRGGARSAVFLVATLAELRLGQSEGETSQVLERAFIRAGTNDFLLGFRDLLPSVDPAFVSQWKSEWEEADGWPQVVFTVFATTNKMALVDALWCSNGGLRPVVDGVYNRNLHSLRRGEAIETVYRQLGRRQCEYLPTPDGRWKVEFIYCGYGGRYFLIEGDAAEGIVTYVGDGTL